jgi:hypothetical protein
MPGVGRAAGVLASGHLGELTPLVPFALVDAVLAETRGQQPGVAPTADGRVPRSRARLLPGRVMVYFALAMALFGEVGYAGVWAKLITTVPSPTSGAFTRARERIGAAPLAGLFRRLAGGGGAGARCFGLRLVAVDGTCLTVPDSARNLAGLGKRGVRNGQTGYPLVRVVALVECGTRALIDAVFGTMAEGENGYAVDLFADALRPGMLLLADRGFDSNKVIDAAFACRADLLLRIKTTRITVPVRKPFPDGSYLAVVAGHVLRIIEAQVTLTTADGRTRAECWRLATTVTDWRRAPALTMIECYHRRWEIETAFLGLKATILRGGVLRSHSPALLDQEVWALLCVYQLVTTAVTLSLAGTGVRREAGSFAEAVDAARDQVIRAHGILARPGKILAVIGGRVRHRLVARRGTRTGPRSVKRPISKYAYKDLGAPKTTQKATIHIAIIELGPDNIP